MYIGSESHGVESTWFTEGIESTRGKSTRGKSTRGRSIPDQLTQGLSPSAIHGRSTFGRVGWITPS